MRQLTTESIVELDDSGDEFGVEPCSAAKLEVGTSEDDADEAGPEASPASEPMT